MRLQSAIFDMDGTLLDSMPIWRHQCSDLIRELGVEPDPDLDLRMCELGVGPGMVWCRERYHLSQSAEELEHIIDERIDRFYREEVLAKPGVDKVLSILKMEGVWMYVVTGSDRPVVEAALGRTGLLHYFRGILTAREAGCDKRTPRIYEKALRRLQSNKQDTVVFEDAPYAVRTARDAGFRVAAVYDPYWESQQTELQSLADYYIRSYEDWFRIED